MAAGRRTPAPAVPAHGRGSQGIGSEADALVVVRRRAEPRGRAASCLSGVRIVRLRLAAQGEDPDRHRDVVEEIALHLDDVYRGREGARTRRGRRSCGGRPGAQRARHAPPRDASPSSPAVRRRSGRPIFSATFAAAFARCRARPSASAVIVLTLAVGIGACTTVFSIFSTVLLKSLPFPESDRLVLGVGGRQSDADPHVHRRRPGVRRLGAHEPDAGRDRHLGVHDVQHCGRGRARAAARDSSVSRPVRRAPRRTGARTDLHARRGCARPRASSCSATPSGAASSRPIRTRSGRPCG